VHGYRWTLSLRAKVLLLSLLTAISLIIFFGIYPFLAVTHCVDADILVVEGRIGPYAIQFAAKEFNCPPDRTELMPGTLCGKDKAYLPDRQPSDALIR